METKQRAARRPVRRTMLIVGALVLALLAVAAWRWLPRPAIPATAEMQTAAQKLVAARDQSQAEPPAAPAHPKTDRQRLMVAAYALKGTPYKWAAKGPDHLDCSGFTKAAYAKIGIELPDGSFNQATGERPLSSPGQMTPGDLILYRWKNSKGVNHVTMYAGDGWVIGTGTPGQLGEVALYPLSADLVNDGRIITYRHIVLPDER
jgi:cell wall-associated NlpC family hydrolase